MTLNEPSFDWLAVSLLDALFVFIWSDDGDWWDWFCVGWAPGGWLGGSIDGGVDWLGCICVGVCGGSGRGEEHWIPGGWPSIGIPPGPHGTLGRINRN